MPDQPPSIGELVRSIDRIATVLDKLDQKVDNLDMKVDRWREELLELKHRTTSNTEDIAKLKSQRDTDAAKGENRRWMVYLALIGAGLAFASDIFRASGGAG